MIYPQPAQPAQAAAPKPGASGAASAPPTPTDPLQAIEAQLKTLSAQPTWDDAISLMRQDGPRGFRVDIETDSTVSGDQAAEQSGMTELLTGITEFWTGVGPAVESGLIAVDTVKAMTLAAVRRFKLGRVVEDAIDAIGENQPAQKGPDPKTLEAQFKMANLAFQQQQMQADTAMKTRQMALDERSMDLKEQEQRERLAMENKKVDLHHYRETQRLGLENVKHQHDVAADNAKHHLEAVQAASEHLRGVLDHVATMQAQMGKASGPKRVAIQRGQDGRAVALVVQPDEGRMVQ